MTTHKAKSAGFGSELLKILSSMDALFYINKTILLQKIYISPPATNTHRAHLSISVQHRVGHQRCSANVPVEQANNDGRQRGHGQVKQHPVHLVHHRAARKAVEQLVPEEQQDEDGVLVEQVECHIGQSIVAPLAVDKQQAFEEFEARYRKVRSHHGLHALLATDSDPDVSGLNHVHVVRAVTNRQGLHLQVVLHHAHHASLAEKHEEEVLVSRKKISVNLRPQR